MRSLAALMYLLVYLLALAMLLESSASPLRAGPRALRAAQGALPVEHHGE